MKKQGTIETIKIEAIAENKAKTKMVVTAGGKKFDVWKLAYGKEVDSEAYTQFQAGRFAIGDEVTIEYSEADKEFVGDEGKTIKYTARSVWRFLSNETANAKNPNGSWKPGEAPSLSESQVPF